MCEGLLVSVIVPNYNHENYLKQRLDSIINQSYSNFEIILLDDCSTDNSNEILLEYSKHEKVSHYISNNINSGNTFNQWEKGISLAKGDFIWIAESDDFCTPNFIKIVIKPLLENSAVALSYCQSNRVNDKGEITGNWISHTNNLSRSFFLKDFIIEGNLFIENFLIIKNVIPNASGVIFRKNLYREEYLKIDKTLRYCGDWIFYFKMLLNNKVAFISTSCNYFRYHENSFIAAAVKDESMINIIDIDFSMRKKLINFLRQKEIGNAKKIIQKNKAIIKSQKYKKSILLIRSNQKWKGFLTLISVFDEFIKRYKF